MEDNCDYEKIYQEGDAAKRTELIHELKIMLLLSGVVFLSCIGVASILFLNILTEQNTTAAFAFVIIMIFGAFALTKTFGNWMTIKKLKKIGENNEHR